MTRTQEWWDHWFLGLAQYVSTASKDPSTKCGAVIVDNERRVVSTGYNGFPRGVEDNDRLNDRPKKYELTCHAESNAIDFSAGDLSLCTIYTWPFQPCPRCAARIIQNGIERVVTPHVGTYSDVGLRHQFKLALDILREAGVQVRRYSDLQQGEPHAAQELQSSATEEKRQGHQDRRVCQECQRIIEQARRATGARPIISYFSET